MAAAGIGIVIIAIMILIVVGLIAGIVLWATAGRSGTGGEMACGGCGYLVRGLEQLACPECGADLRAVGINSGGSGGRRLTGILLTAICGFLVLSCLGFSAIGFLSIGQSVQSAPMQPPQVQSGNSTTPPGAGQASDSDGGDEADEEDEGQDTPPEPESP